MITLTLRELEESLGGSAEVFRDAYLIPTLEGLRAGEKLQVDLSGALCLTIPWLKEVFGGLVRMGYTHEELRGRILITSSYKPDVVRSWREIESACEPARVPPTPEDLRPSKTPVRKRHDEMMLHLIGLTFRKGVIIVLYSNGKLQELNPHSPERNVVWNLSRRDVRGYTLDASRNGRGRWMVWKLDPRRDPHVKLITVADDKEGGIEALMSLDET